MEARNKKLKIVQVVLFQCALFFLFFSIGWAYYQTYKRDSIRSIALLILSLPVIAGLTYYNLKCDLFHCFLIKKQWIIVAEVLVVACAFQKLLGIFFTNYILPFLYNGDGEIVFHLPSWIIPNGNNLMTYLIGSIILFAVSLCFCSYAVYFFSFRICFSNVSAALLGVLTFCFLILVSTPAEIFLTNRSDFDCTIGEFLRTQLSILLVFVIILSVVFLMLKEEHKTKFILFTATISISVYIQKLFLNPNTGNIDQNEVQWSSFSNNFIPNSIIWVLILAGFCILYKLFKQKTIQKLCIFSFVLILAMQVTSVISLLLSNVDDEDEKTATVLSGTEQFTFGRDGNVIVVCLDYFSNDLFDDYSTEKGVDFLKDFTYFSNYNGYFASTTPSVTYYLTGIEFDPSIKFDEWYRSAWNSERARSFYALLKQNGYDTYLYAHSIGNADNMNGIAENIESLNSTERQINKANIMDYFSKIGIYMSLPTALKEIIFYYIPDMYFVQYNDVKSIKSENYDFYEGLYEEIEIEEGKRFIYYHLDGVHAPYHTNAECLYSEQASIEETLDGNMLLLEKLISELKNNDIYDNSVIIIMADHGDITSGYCQPLFLIKQRNQENTQLTENKKQTGHSNLQATVLESIGVNNTKFGSSVFSSSVGDAERSFWTFCKASNFPNAYKYNSQVFSTTANAAKKYVYDGDRNTLRSIIEQDEYEEVVPIVEAPW